MRKRGRSVARVFGQTNAWYGEDGLNISNRPDPGPEGIKVGVSERVLGRDPLLAVELEEAGDEVDAVLVEAGRALHQRLGRILREVVVLELLGHGDALPGFFVRGAEDLENEMQLVLYGGAGEERPP